MFVYLFTFILRVWDFLWCKTIIFGVKTSILHQFTELKASVVGISSGIEYTTVGFLSGRYLKRHNIVKFQNPFDN